jgi:hypothetical protein
MIRLMESYFVVNLMEILRDMMSGIIGGGRDVES